jgi:hypothetical protein
MLTNMLQFELRYWLKRPMVWVFLLLNTLLVFFAVTSDNVTIGQSYGSVHKNAPFVLQSMYGNMSIIMLLMATAFLQGAALRDFNNKTHQIIFSTPLRKFPYLMGRYLGACIIALIPLLGVTLAGILGSFAPWVAPEQLGPLNLSGDLWGMLLFGIPNTLLIGAIIFGIATLTRSTIGSFIGALGVLVGYGIAVSQTSDLDSEYIAMLVDPFGLSTFQIITKYWTVAEKNTMALGAHPMMLLNRAIWLGAGALIWFLTYTRFSFTLRNKKKKKQADTAEETPSTTSVALPKVTLQQGFGVYFRQMLSQARLDFVGVIKGAPFLVILLFGILNMAPGIASVNGSYGLDLYPVTYRIIDNIRGSMYLSVIAILIFYSGALIWKERDAKADEIYGSLPYPNWVPVISKILAMTGIIAALQLISILTGVVAQTIKGYTNYELGVYLKELMVLDLLGFFFVAVLSMLLHTLINNKYLAYFAVVAFIIVNSFIWLPLDIFSNMLSFGATPSYTYSDMNGFGPFITGLTWFNVYWFLFSLLLLGGTVFFWVRGKDTVWKNRRQAAAAGLRQSRWPMLGLLGLWVLTAGFVFYNTQMLNDYDTPKASRKLSAAYEKTFSYLEKQPQPHVVDAKYEIDLYPEARDLNVKAQLRLTNNSGQPIDTMVVNLIDDFETEITVEGARLVREETDFQMQFYAFEPALQAGDTISMQYTGKIDHRGFENEVSNVSIVPNGSFFNNMSITPSFGYQESREISEKRYRKKYDLPEKESMPPLQRECTDAYVCRHHYLGLHADWVTAETTISTAKGQTAVAPGSLVRKWEEGDRAYFQYKLDHPSMNFYSFISADYEVEREKWQDVDVEVYYQEGHEYNVENMASSIRNSLAYYSKNFSPYRHKQARIIEFPRYASFAQAFPGTMPYSEGIGFIAEIEEDQKDVDMVYYVVAHEMAHQWWAHQVIGSGMQGATLLSETLAQYSALMVMEETYGQERIHKFLKYEVDSYLRGRGRETEREKPLLEVYANQGYIHYRKGSAVMYYLKEMIGEDRVNAALRSVIDSFAYQQPPYPNAHHLVDAFRAQTPDSLQYLITDMFETITLFDNRVQDPTYRELDNGKYEVNFTAYATKFRADSLGTETEIPIRDYIDVAVFAEPEEDEERGRVLHQERLLIQNKETPVKIVVDERPYEAGFDPNYYLIDRMPDDNVQRVKAE